MHSARQIFDAGGAAPISLLFPLLILNDGQTVGTPAATNTEIAAADAAAAGTFGFWGTLGRVGWDGANADTSLVTNAFFPFPNAMWVIIRNQMWFAPGMVRADVVGHEFTHGVIEATAKLLYLDESGAVNEHYADVMGNLAFPDTPPTQWFVGETATGGVGNLRDMKAPTVSNYAFYSRRGTGCDGVFDPIKLACDFGGVHTNSGIGNRAAVLLSDGDGTPQHPGIGRSRLGRLFADTLTTRLHPWSTFLDELHNTWEAARDLQLRGVQPAALPATALRRYSTRRRSMRLSGRSLRSAWIVG